MPDFADPLIEGLMAGLKFKEYFRNASRQAEELKMRKEQIAEARQQRERQNELMDLQQRITMTGAGIRPVTPEDTFRASLRGVPRYRADETGEMSQIGAGVSGSDVGDRMLNFRGQNLVIPTEAETDKRLADRARAKAYAELGAKEDVREKFGQSFELAPGVATTVLPSEITNAFQRRSQIERDTRAAEASRALAEFRRRPAAPKQLPVAWKSDAKGNLVGVTLDAAGAPVVTPVPGVMAAPPKGPAGGTGELARERFEFGKREAVRKEQEAEDAKQETKVQSLLAEEEKHHGERVARGQELASDELDKKKRPEVAAQFAAATQRIRDIQHRKAKLLGAAIPPKAAQDALKEGESRTAPDGHVWYKKDGIVYIVK